MCSVRPRRARSSALTTSAGVFLLTRRLSEVHTLQMPNSWPPAGDRCRPMRDVTLRSLVGREEELAALVRLLDASDQLPGAAVLPGEAGIGKTTLWLAAIDVADARGYRTMSCRPSEAETQFAFAGLADLLGHAAADVLPELPPIQRRALEAALLLGETETHADDRAVAAAFLGALRLLARDRPVCLAVDDIQWLDAASIAALRYALARLERESVAALLTVRGGLPPWLRRAVAEERLLTIEMGGLSVGALEALLRARLDATFPRPTLIRLWQTSGGNPFYALELAGALQRKRSSLAFGEELRLQRRRLTAFVAGLAEPPVRPIRRRADKSATPTSAEKVRG